MFMQKLDKDPIGERFTFYQHAIAVENDKFDGALIHSGEIIPARLAF